ncbi:hypothetical protein KXJ74_11575 [Acinetobacter johnsonii]|nr:hypothetical protein KXJ74_11575 [Acinetobacter johnsonii]
MITNYLKNEPAAHTSATQRMQDIRQRFKNTEHQHEFYIAHAFNTVNFDQSFASFQRLDQLFTAFNKQVGILDIQHDSEPSQLNSLMLIASHLGQFLAERTATAEQWFSRSEIKKNLPQSAVSLPDSFLYDYSLVLNNKIVFPLLIVHQYFQQADIPLTFSQKIEIEILNQLIAGGEEKNKIAEEMHALQNMYQKNYTLNCGSSFLKLVEISNLDYSLQSLDRLDELMHELRQNYIASAEKFLSEQSNFYFILYLSGYLGRVIAQHAGTSLRWLNPQQVSQMIGSEITPQLQTCRVAQIHNQVFFTTGHIADFLFSPVIQTSSLQYANKIIQDILKIRTPLYLAHQPENTAYKASVFHDALHQAGFLLGYVFQFIHGVMPRHDPNASMDPTSFPPGNTFIKHMDGPDAGLKQLELNLQDYPYNILAYEMYACLPHLRTDAISLHIRQYGEHAINLHAVVPYFPVFDYRGFQILQPYLSACDSKTEQEMPLILDNMQAFFDGIHTFEMPLPTERKVWAAHYKPAAHPYPQNFSQN